MEAARKDAVSDQARNGKLSDEARQFYRRVYGPARAGCLNQLRLAGCSEEEAEEIFQGTFERVMQTVDPIARGFAVPQMVNMLKTSCRHRLIDERRHGGVLQRVPLADVGSLPDNESDTPVEFAESHEMVAIGREAVASLPDRDRQVFMQRHHRGLGPDEILENFPGLSRRTYRKIMQRANARVLAAFEQIDSGARCQDMERHYLRGYVSNEISTAEVAAVKAHLDHCRGCQQTVVGMRGYLHDVASGLGIVGTSSAEVHGHGNLLAEAASRFLDAGHALAESTRALRDRLREQAIRAATSIPGSGGDPAAGQVLGASSAKVVAGACGVVGSGIAVGATCAVLGVSPLAAVGLQEEGSRSDAIERQAESPATEGPEYVPAPNYEPAPPAKPESKAPPPEDSTEGSSTDSGESEPVRPPSESGPQTDEELGLGGTGRPPRSSPPPTTEEPSGAAPSVSPSSEAPSAPEGSGGGGSAPVRGGSEIGP